MGGLSRKQSALHQLAAMRGVLTSYLDFRGQWREASPEVLVRVLRELDVPIDGSGDAAEALRWLRAERARDEVSPCAVARGGRPAVIEVRAASGRDERYVVEIELESGETRRLRGSLGQLSVAGAPRRGEVAVRQLEVADLPIGYHRARVELGARVFDTLIIACPERAYQEPELERSWGVFAPTYALRSAGRTGGGGSLAELGELAERVRRLGGAIVGTLPLTACHYDVPYEPSPYSPVSRLCWNELFIDLGDLGLGDLGGEVDGDPAVRAARERAERERAARDAEPLVDYRAQMAQVRPVLEAAARVAWAGDSARAELGEALRERPRLDDYARFRAAGEHFGAPWSMWPEGPRSGSIGDGDFDPEAYRYHAYCQLVLARQLAAFKGRRDRAGLYLDLPVGVSREGYDVWRERGAFSLGCSVGAPPDALFLGGQNWGLPPLHPSRIRERGYRYVIECFRAQLEHATALRIDHVMGLHRLYWIPEGAEATEGVYVRYPFEELYAILILESHRQRCELFGEDLGTVPEEVPVEMERAGMGRLYVAQFGLPSETDDAPAPPPPSSVASFGTHDTPTFAGYWAGRDIDQRLELGLITEDEAEEERRGREATRRATEAFLIRRGYARESGKAGAMRGLQEYLAASGARVALVSLDDLLLDEEPQNVPGTTAEELPNWRRRMARELDDAMADPSVSEVLAAVHERRHYR